MSLQSAYQRQVFTVWSLALLGAWVFHIPIHWQEVVGYALGCVGAQFLWKRDALLPSLITAASLSLLLRLPESFAAVPQLFLAMGCGAMAISSKFLISRNDRSKHQHFFNPANFVIIPMLIFGVGWITAGQWGDNNLMIVFALIMGLLILSKAESWRVAFGFLSCLALLHLLRMGYIGYPAAVMWHQLSQTSILLFAFFMITDPKTTPSSSIGQLAFGACIAVITALLAWGFFVTNAVFYALFITCALRWANITWQKREVL